MNFEIRKAEKKDMLGVLDCIRALAIFENEEHTVEVTLEDLEKDGFSENPLFETFVGLVEGEIVGIALFYYRYSTWKGKTIHLEDLIVKEDFRGIGLGKALYDAVMKYGAAQNLKRIEWNVLDWNTNAIKFYESTGAKVLPGWQVVHMDEESLQLYSTNL